VDSFVWLLALYAHYFIAMFVVGTVVLGLLWLASPRPHPRTSPEPTDAQSSAPDGKAAA
jgi:hypothetical protein